MKERLNIFLSNYKDNPNCFLHLKLNSYVIYLEGVAVLVASFTLFFELTIILFLFFYAGTLLKRKHIVQISMVVWPLMWVPGLT